MFIISVTVIGILHQLLIVNDWFMHNVNIYGIFHCRYMFNVFSFDIDL